MAIYIYIAEKKMWNIYIKYGIEIINPLNLYKRRIKNS